MPALLRFVDCGLVESQEGLKHQDLLKLARRHICQVESQEGLKLCGVQPPAERVCQGRISRRVETLSTCDANCASCINVESQEGLKL